MIKTSGAGLPLFENQLAGIVGALKDNRTDLAQLPGRELIEEGNRLEKLDTIQFRGSFLPPFQRFP